MNDEPHPSTSPHATPSSVAGRARHAAKTVALGGLVGALSPVWLAHDRATRAVTSRRTGAIEALARVETAGADLDALFASRRPVVVRGLAAQLGLATVATRADLVSRAGDTTVPIVFHDAEQPYFLYSGGYGETVRRRDEMSLRSFLALLFDEGLAAYEVVYRLLGPQMLDGAAREILGEYDAALRLATRRPTEPRFSGIWIGSTGVVTPLHHDAWPGLLFQTEGRKRVAMFAPRDRTNLYFRNPLVGRGRWSELPGRSAAADPAHFPRLRHVTRYEAVLDPGDTLVIPPFWAHEMEGLEPNISVPFRFATSLRSYLDPGFLRPASELLRKQLSA